MKNEPLYQMACPIARSLGRVGDGWSMLIMRDALAGFTRFDEFQKNSGVAPNILSRRLKELVEDGLLEKVCYSTTPMRHPGAGRVGQHPLLAGRKADAAGGNRHPASSETAAGR